ncbi:MAG: PRC-barrel domain-containing protein [Sarcina sp.]
MYRFKNLKALEVFDKNSVKLGEVEDIAIDYFEGRVLGFILPKKMFSKKNFVAIEDIIILGNRIVTEKLSIYKGLTFLLIKEFDVINSGGESIGNLEELIINLNFKIVAIICSRGFFYKFVHGKELVLIEKTILGKRNILYLGEDNLSFKSLPHSLWRRNE